MPDIEVNVNPGVCGFKTAIKTSSGDRRNATIDFKTQCPNLKPLETELKVADGYKECFAKFGKSPVCETAFRYCKHAACPVPTAILKGIEAACGLALPRDAVIEVKKTENG